MDKKILVGFIVVLAVVFLAAVVLLPVPTNQACAPGFPSGWWHPECWQGGWGF